MFACRSICCKFSGSLILNPFAQQSNVIFVVFSICTIGLVIFSVELGLTSVTRFSLYFVTGFSTKNQNAVNDTVGFYLKFWPSKNRAVNRPLFSRKRKFQPQKAGGSGRTRIKPNQSESKARTKNKQLYQLPIGNLNIADRSISGHIQNHVRKNGTFLL